LAFIRDGLFQSLRAVALSSRPFFFWPVLAAGIRETARGNATGIPMDEITARIDKEVANASKTPREILQLIFEMAYKTVESDDIKNRITMARFATLLVNLSEQANKITQENLKMQRKLVCLNWTLIFLTAGLFIATIALLVVEAIHIWHR
jgi:hypothetical protein